MRNGLPARICLYLCFLGVLVLPVENIKPFAWSYLISVLLFYIVMTIITELSDVPFKSIKKEDTFLSTAKVFLAVTVLVDVFHAFDESLGIELAVASGLEVVFTVSAVRQSRIQHINGARVRLINIVSEISVFLMIAGVSFLLMLLYRKTGNAFFIIVFPVLLIPILIGRGLSYILQVIINNISWKTVEHVPVSKVKPDDAVIKNMDFSDILDQFSDLESARSFDARIILYSLLAVGIICFTVFLLKNSERNRASKAETQISVSAVGRRHAKTGNGLSRLGKAAKIRRMYRSYLRKLENRGIEIRPCTTSLDVLNRNQSESAEVFRDIYIQARYGNSGLITEEKVRLAAEILKTLN